MGAPEQFEGEEADVRADIYQLGTLLLVMLTGKFRNENGAEFLVKRKDVPDRLTEAILRCLQRDWAERLHTVSDMKDALLSRNA